MVALVPTATTTSTGFSVNPILSLILAIIFAAACYFIAQRKGRRVWLWAVLGFFFGIISLIIILVLKPTPRAPVDAYGQPQQPQGPPM